MKILTILGARPQFIKAAAISRIIAKQPEIQEVIIHTGQHYDDNMSDIFFRELSIPKPDYNLGIGSGNHGKQTGLMLTAIEEVLSKEKPNIIIVYGDTNSTLAGALAAAKMHIPIAHIEAGLRSYNLSMPEEVNRIITDRVSQFLFCPTEISLNNLRQEGINHYANAQAFNVGDVMFDAAMFYGNMAHKNSDIIKELELNTDYVLATVHRAENTNVSQRLSTIIQGLKNLSRHISIVFPIHPRTRQALLDNQLYQSLSTFPNIKVIEPVGFLDMITLEKRAQMIVTDSGGIQKEAYFYNKPCITLRDETEWIETVNAGWNRLVSPLSIETFPTEVFSPDPNQKKNFYGTGKASQKIIDILLSSDTIRNIV